MYRSDPDPCIYKVAAWNVHGSAQLKLTDEPFCDYICRWDVVFLLETHLYPGEEDTITLDGYDMFAVSRPMTPNMTRRGGGVLALVRHGLPFVFEAALTQSDILVLRCGQVYFVSAYLPPSTSPWCQTTVSPVQRLRETLSICETRGQVVLLGDLNARLQDRSLHACYPRQSPDLHGAIGTRGREILDLATDHNLVILNGTNWQDRDSLPRLTSFQALGEALIDYVLTSESLIRATSEPTILSMTVHKHVRCFADHAAVSVNICCNRSECTEPIAEEEGVEEDLPSPTRNSLDDMLDKVLRAPSDHATLLAKLYGEAYVDTAPIQVYTNGSYHHQGSPQAKAGAGIFWGFNNVKNQSLRTPGPGQTNNRGEVHAIFAAIQQAKADVTLILRSDSEYAIRCICHWAPRLQALGWTCPNGDLLQSIVALIKGRIAPIRFYWVKGHAGNPDQEASDGLANEGSKRTSVVDFIAPAPIIPLPHPPSPLKCHKVSCNLKPYTMSDSGQTLSTQRPAPTDTVSDAAYVRLLQEERAQQLTGSKSDRKFWEAFRNMMDPRPTAPRVTARQLQNVFEERMNPSAEVPAHFDPIRHNANQACAATLPAHSIDDTVDHTFSRAITAKEVAKVKAHIRKQCLGAARGLDKISYRRILTIPNDLLCELFQKCIDTCDAPSTWLTALLVGVAKKGSIDGVPRDLNDPTNYRTIGLESCLVKTLTLLIDRRLREWSDTAGRIPDSQNGFRSKHRTNNNAFVLRTAIEKARSERSTLR